ncbi:cell wall hydrolase [Qipengyuania oceanensis]|uniref:Cell wall hydrolase n=1 Tax=Qipengyuania oceanensis TaxID=1463597 RepID=A0A844YFU7_9SPHN|nr:cell wall hydrolase [Qipengyuania oceanensis]MXO63031.1 cell wall hydrolase [Qipengyuania oceanensis]
MSRKTAKASLAAIAAGIFVIFSSVDGSGANAQAADSATPAQSAEIALTDEIVPASAAAEEPVTVSQPVVQPLPQDDTAEDRPSVRVASSLHELVAHTEVSEQLSEEMQCLAGAVYFESRGEPLDGQLAVAQVIINRAESRQFPASYCSVVYQRSQFSFVKNGAMPQIRTSSNAWRKARAIARIAHEGMWDSKAADSLYFHAKYVRPGWANKKIARATIDSHIFYR